MPIVNSSSKAVVREFSLEELEQAARLMRGYDLVALCAAGSGHSGGTLSMMEIVAALYLKVANHDPNNPDWKERDRIIWSGGHKAPALYLGLGFAGYFPIEDIVTLRKLYSPFQGHPHQIGRSATVASGLVDIKPPLYTSASASPDTSPSKTSLPCASCIRHSRDIPTRSEGARP